GGGLILLMLVAGLLMRRQRAYMLVGSLWFLGTLVPGVGIVQVGNQAWADRYTYLPLIGLFVILVWFCADWIANAAFRPQKSAVQQTQTTISGRFMVVSAGTVVVLGTLMLVGTSLQLRYWRDTRTLFQHAANVTHHNAKAL